MEYNFVSWKFCKIVKVAWWKKHFCMILNIQQNLTFPTQNWQPGFWFGFSKEEKWVRPARQWLCWPAVTKKLRETDLKMVNTEWQGKYFFFKLRYIRERFYHQATFKFDEDFLKIRFFLRKDFNPLWHHMAFRLPMLRFTYAGCQTRKYFPAQIIAAAFRITI